MKLIFHIQDQIHYIIYQSILIKIYRKYLILNSLFQLLVIIVCLFFFRQRCEKKEVFKKMIKNDSCCVR